MFILPRNSSNYRISTRILLGQLCTWRNPSVKLTIKVEDPLCSCVIIFNHLKGKGFLSQFCGRSTEDSRVGSLLQAAQGACVRAGTWPPCITARSATIYTVLPSYVVLYLMKTSPALNLTPFHVWKRVAVRDMRVLYAADPNSSLY